MEHPVRTICLVILLSLYLFAVVRFILRYFGPVKTAMAEVVAMHRTGIDTNQAQEGNRCVITFQIGEKRKSFYVTEERCSTFQMGQRGTLTYRGERLVDFHENN